MTETMQEPTFAPEVTEKQHGQKPQQDYFGFSRSDKFMLPDGVSWIECTALNEGAKKVFQDKTSRDVVIGQNREARMSVLQGSERHELIRTAIKDWNLTRNGTPLPCDARSISDFLTLADPLIVEDLEKFVRKLNPWLLTDMKAEDIRKEITNLEEMLVEAEKREAGEAN